MIVLILSRLHYFKDNMFSVEFLKLFFKVIKNN